MNLYKAVFLSINFTWEIAKDYFYR